jgi:hypothetical protein
MEVEKFRLADHPLVVEVVVRDEDVEIEQQFGELGQFLAELGRGRIGEIVVAGARDVLPAREVGRDVDEIQLGDDPLAVTQRRLRALGRPLAEGGAQRVLHARKTEAGRAWKRLR